MITPNRPSTQAWIKMGFEDEHSWVAVRQFGHGDRDSQAKGNEGSRRIECGVPKRTSANIIISDKGKPMIKKQHYPGNTRRIWFEIRRPSRPFEFRQRSEVIGSEHASVASTSER